MFAFNCKLDKNKINYNKYFYKNNALIKYIKLKI